jgi:diguanylate cyclase (GGDEF)-like protein
VITFAVFADAPIYSPVNLYLIPILACVSIYFLISSVLDLIGYRLSNIQALLFAGSLLFLMVTVAARIESVSSQIIVAIMYLFVGLAATYVLKGHSKPHRLIGPLLILLALHPLISISGTAESIALQFAVGAVLRTAFGFAALYVSLDQASNAARESSDRFARLTQYSVQGVTVLNRSQLLYANSATLKIYGAANETELTHQFMSSASSIDPKSLFWYHVNNLLSGQMEYVSWEERLERTDGQIRELHFFAYKTTWKNQAAVCVMISDDTERLEISREVLRRATHDALTGLPNRSVLMQQLREFSVQSNSASMHFYLYFLNIDRFKLFNSAHGFGLGDEILKSLVCVLKAAIDGKGMLFHIGIDEFALLFSSDHVKQSIIVIENSIMETLSHPLKVSGGEFYIDVSIGRATYPENGTSAELIVRACNAAMHFAKRTPGACLVHAEQSYEQSSSEMLILEQALRLGIKRREVYLCYQPKVDSKSHQLLGFEALARWDRPGVGMVSPQLFIQAAETTGLIVELGKLILKTACQQLAHWRDEGVYCVPVAVNVSPWQLLNSKFPDIVVDMLAEFRLPPHLLTLEITESAAVENLQQTQAQLGKLRDLGISIAMDDFGTGFSSLSMLRKLPLNSVKIDKALIDPLPAEEGTAVVKAICQLSSALGLKVVAEGVETPEQAEAAKEAGCDEFQGYCFGKPLSSDDARLLLLASGQ